MEHNEKNNTRSGYFLSSFRIYLVSAFIADLVVPVFYVYLPLLAYEIGANSLQIGIVGGANYLVFSFVPLFMGHFSDRARSRKLFVVLSLLIICMVSFVYSFVGTPSELIFVRLLEGIGWSMLWPSIEAGISETTPGDAAHNFGVYNFIWSGASALGPLFGAVLIFAFSTRFVFLMTALIMIIPIVINVISIKSISKVKISSWRKRGKDDEGSATSTSKVADEHGTLRSERSTSSLGDFPRVLKKNSLYILCTVLSTMMVGTLLTFFSPYAKSVGISVLVLGGIVFTYGITRFLSFLLISRHALRSRLLSQKNRNQIVLGALAVSSISGVLFYIANGSIPLYVLGLSIIAIANPIITSVTQVRLIAEAPVSQMGRGAGISESSIGLGSFLGPFLGGLLSGGSLQFPFLLPTLIVAGMMLPLILYFSRLT